MSDAEWAFFAPFLIENRSRGGRRPQDHRYAKAFVSNASESESFASVAQVKVM
ncbi:MAG TPA: hypothetical protein VM468_03990 [Mycoplana sp.]|nr:hypothetical protein [Mycoplana sp.]